jgi:hypothetical protein
VNPVLAAGLALAVAVIIALVGLWLVGAAIRWTHRARRRWRRRILPVLIAYRWLKRREHAPRPAVLAGDDIYRTCDLSTWEGGPWACRMCNGLIPRNRTRFCGPQCTDAALDNHVFDRARAARRRMDGYRCVRCGSTEHLEVNHKTPILGLHDVPGCHHHLSNLETLCGGGGTSCHQFTTNGQRARGEFRRRAS